MYLLHYPTFLFQLVIFFAGILLSLSATAKTPNILLIVSEDNGPELGCYGDPYARTPHLDKLASEGVRFENAFVPYSVCSPSRACFLTGLYPHQNGQIGLATHKFELYKRDTPNFATLFKAKGYRTGLIGKLHVNPEDAFSFDSHTIRGANFNRKQSGEDYALEAAKFFKGSGDNTIIFYFGDHGAQFPRGKGSVYEGGLRVPLIVRWPSVAQAGLVRKELVSTVDLLPTSLAAAGIAAPSNLPGWDLKALLTGTTPDKWRKYIFAFTTGSFPRNCFIQHSLRDDRYKLISSPRPDTKNLIAGSYLDELHQHFVISGATADDQSTVSPTVKKAFALWSSPPRYDLKEDPYEWKNLADDPMHVETRARLIKALIDLQKRTHDPFIEQKNVEAFVAEQLDNRDMKYRKKKDFRWSYLKGFLQWRKTMKE